MHHISVILHPMGMYYTILETGYHEQNDGSKIREKLSLSIFGKSPIGAPLCPPTSSLSFEPSSAMTRPTSHNTRMEYPTCPILRAAQHNVRP